MIPTGYPIDVRDSERQATYAHWPYKREAVTALGKLQTHGLNLLDTITAYRARGNFSYYWVLGRPDDLAEMTLLMREDGSWERGRLFDSYTDCRWVHLPLPSGPIRAPFTHVTRTVLVANRGERYKAKSNGSCGRWVRNEDAVALCTCGWKSYATDRAEARSSAATHRMEVAS